MCVRQLALPWNCSTTFHGVFLLTTTTGGGGPPQSAILQSWLSPEVSMAVISIPLLRAKITWGVSSCLPHFPIGYTVIGCMEEMQTQISGEGGHLWACVWACSALFLCLMPSDTWLVGSVDNAVLRMLLVLELVLLILDYRQSNLVHCLEWSYANCRWTVTRKLMVSTRKLMPAWEQMITFCQETQARTQKNHILKSLTRFIRAKKWLLYTCAYVYGHVQSL